jgi:uncharacterized protein (TIGR03437 family)
VNGASFFPGVVPGSIVSIIGAGLAPGVQGIVTPRSLVGQLPTTLSGVTVTFNGVQAPIFSVSNVNGQEQVTVQVPYEIAPPSAQVVVNVSGGSSTLTVPVQALQPGIFETIDSNNRRYAVATRPDGSFVSPSNPARKGENITTYLTGLGQVSPTAGTNRAGIANQVVNANLIVGVNNAGVPFISAQAMPGVIGIYTVTFTVPNDTPSGSALNLAVAASGANGVNVYSNTSTIAVQ